ncbi:dermonecrotic toxin domain-containing protein [Pseudomonas sivasensis]|uniref:RING-type E3 ubiquitin transferase n=1 Tax=Pseudomonas sivasensis TaxID=1880678 RepID=A0ABW8E4J8_9PSED|nr:DUF6543 domain-containing protein [Pseudomonas sivasensis]
MPNIPSPASSSPGYSGVHYDFLKSRVPSWFLQAPKQRQQELADHPLQLPDWYLKADSAGRASLAVAHTRFRDAQRDLEDNLARIDDVLDFAEPLLKAQIQQRFNMDLDVRQVYFARKYTPGKEQAAFGGFFTVDQTSSPDANYRYRGVTLLEAALANFEPSEEQPLSCRDCSIITRFSAFEGEVIPGFDVLQDQAVAILPHEFAQLCRSLNVGKLYQEHLKAVLEPQDQTQRTALENQLHAHQRQQFTLSLDIASRQRLADANGRAGVSASARRMLDQVLSGSRNAYLDGSPVTFAALKIFGIVLVGPLLIGPERLSSVDAERVVVYIPNDPQQPMREYASGDAFMADLRARLHSIAYRRFFSQFIPVQHQGEFFQQLNKLYQPKESDDTQTDFVLQAEPARLPIEAFEITGDVWIEQRQAHMRKLLSDARAVAVPTGDEDAQARARRMAGFLDAVLNVFNLAAFVVPGLGPIMLAVGAGQMMTDVFHGIEAYEQGEIKEMWRCFSSVALNAAFFAAGAAVLPHVQWSGQVESLRNVRLPTGGKTLWRPRLDGYELPDYEPQGQADEHGVYRQNGQSVLAIEGKHYRIVEDATTGHYRIQHPTRAEAYQPLLRHNNQGGWLHEADRPQEWTGATLMRRIGPAMEGFSDEELEQIRQVSDVHEDQLRRIHAQSEPVPAVLLDTAQQFRAYGQAKELNRQITAGRLSAELTGYAASLVTELAHWPASTGIEVLGEDGLDTSAVRYGNRLATGRDLIRISRAELMQGQLSRRIVEHLSHEQLTPLLGERIGLDTPSRAAELTRRLAEYAATQHTRLFKSLYSERLAPKSPAVQVLQRDFKRLPSLIAQELLDSASPKELEFITAKGRLPLRLAEEARKLQAQMRLLHAYEGLYLERLDNPDTETLVLHSLENLPGWHDNIRLEVREGSFDGSLRAVFGAEDAGQRKVLARVADGLYQPFDEEGNELHGTDSLYRALQHALPDAHRNAISLPHVGQGDQLHALVIQRALPRDALSNALRIAPRNKPFFRFPQRAPSGQPGYPLSGRGVGGVEGTFRRRLRTLYPSLTEEQVEAFLQDRSLTDDAWLRALERDFAHLEATFYNWLLEGPKTPSILRARYRIVDAIMNAWRMTGELDIDPLGNVLGQRIKLRGGARDQQRMLGAQLATLPELPGNFDHVTNLQVTRCDLTDQGARFLSAFRRVRLLDLSENRLTVLPPALANMPFMEGLDLADNALVLTAETAQHINNMTRLISLTLAGNPIGEWLNLKRLRFLQWLELAGCGLKALPAGLFAHPRPRGFVLDLTGNPITEMPDVAPGSDRAETIARIVVTRELLAPEALDRLKLYIESIGMDAGRRFPPRGVQDSAHWMAGLTQEEWVVKARYWDAVEELEGSEPFFNELRKLNESSDAGTPEYRNDLTAKVWRMIEAMHEDSVLCDTLFKMAAAPTTCVDAGAQLFNAMGGEVLVSQANAIPNVELKKIELLDLARGRARLHELGRIAQARVNELLAQGRNFPQYDAQGELVRQYDAQGNALRSIDEVEIYLAYATRLAGPLDLPWQSKSMMFNEPDVTSAMVDEAYLRVRALEEGDQLRNQIVEESFWANFVESLNPEPFKVLQVRGDDLISLQVAQQEWANDGDLSPQQKQALRETIDTTVLALGKSSVNSVSGHVMSDEEYFSDISALQKERLQLLYTMTDQIMGRSPQPAQGSEA